MSFRDTRRLCERMRALGCKQFVSMENFRTPNFELVAELLFWLLRRYDPGTSLQDDIDTPAERMQFLESIAHALFLKARLKLNIKRLYAADGRAVHELLKVTDLLFAASQRANTDAEEISRGTESALEELGHMEKTVKCVREAVLDINRAGQEIHAHLALEPELSSARQQILGQHTDKADIERAVQDAVDQLIEEDEQLQSRIEHLEVQKTENEDKLRRKQAERERMEQRLMQMKNVSAPYQDEVDTVFQELQGVSSVYLAKFRTLEYLEEELGKIRKDEEARMRAEEVKLERLRQRIEDHDWKLIRGQLSVHENEVATEFKDLDGDSSDESIAAVPAKGFGAPQLEQVHRGSPHDDHHGRVFSPSRMDAGGSVVMHDVQQAQLGTAVQGSLVIANTSADGSDDAEQTDTSQVDKFEAMNKELGFSADGLDDIDVDDDDDYDGIDVDDF